MQYPVSAERLPSGDAVLILDERFSVAYCSAAAAELFGRDPDDLLGTPASGVLDGIPREGEGSATAVRPDGRRVGTQVRVEPWEVSGERYFIVMLDGVARSEAKYRELAGMFAESQRFAHVGSFSVDVATRRMRWSDELFRIFDLEPASRAVDLGYMVSRAVPEDRDLLAAALEDALHGESGLDLRFRIAGGRERVVRAVGHVSTGGGPSACLFGSVLDITADEDASRHRVELTRELDEAKRMTSLGRVAATMAHEFNNVLAGIGSFAEYLNRRAADDEMRRAVSHIGKAVRRGKTVTDEILRYTRAKPPALAIVDVCAWLEGFMPEANVLTGGRALLERGEQQFIRGDVAQLNQVLVNLLINARDASPPDSPIVLRAATGEREGMPMLDLAVVDRGTGIPPEIRERMFEPLFTTKRSGTGLGLPVVDQIVRAHHGVVRVRSEMGKGTEFHILIPLHDGAGTVAPRVLDSVLIADDDATFANGICDMLKLEGIRARVVNRGDDVIPALRHERPNVLILAVGLPDMRGPELYGAIADRWPDLPVVFVSGRSSDELEPLLRQRHVAFLAKPFAAEDLLAALRSVLIP